MSSEEELDPVAWAAAAGVPLAAIVDSGLTEFGVPTMTCIGVGPDWPDVVDAITGSLPLL